MTEAYFYYEILLWLNLNPRALLQYRVLLCRTTRYVVCPCVRHEFHFFFSSHSWFKPPRWHANFDRRTLILTPLDLVLPCPFLGLEAENQGKLLSNYVLLDERESWPKSCVSWALRTSSCRLVRGMGKILTKQWLQLLLTRGNTAFNLSLFSAHNHRQVFHEMGRSTMLMFRVGRCYDSYHPIPSWTGKCQRGTWEPWFDPPMARARSSSPFLGQIGRSSVARRNDFIDTTQSFMSSCTRQMAVKSATGQRWDRGRHGLWILSAKGIGTATGISGPRQRSKIRSPSPPRLRGHGRGHHQPQRLAEIKCTITFTTAKALL